MHTSRRELIQALVIGTLGARLSHARCVVDSDEAKPGTGAAEATAAPEVRAQIAQAEPQRWPSPFAYAMACRKA